MKIQGFFLMIPILAVSSTCGSPVINTLENGRSDTALTGTVFNDSFYNPVMSDGPDPFVAYHNGWYYFTATYAGGLTIRKSITLSGLLPTEGITVWRGSDNGLNEIWAPEIFFINGFWYAYLAAKPITGTHSDRRMYVLKSDTADALGAWTFIGKMDLPEDEWAIDGTLFINTDGKYYFIWSGWPANVHFQYQYLYICELDNPSTVKSGTIRVEISRPDKDWEGAINEGPIMLKQPDGKIKCVYSGNTSLGDDYCLGELTLTPGGNPMLASSWVKSASPILQKDPARHVYGPGHNSFTVSPDGTEVWMVYHEAKVSGSGFNRRARIQKVDFDPQGNIVMGGPMDSNTPYTLPAGEVVNRLLFEAEAGELSGGAQKVSSDVAGGGNAVRFNSTSSKIVLTLNIPVPGNYYAYLRYSRDERYENTPASQIPGKFAYLESNGKTSRFAIDICSPDQFITAAVNNQENNKLSLAAGKNTLTLWGVENLIADSFVLELAN